MKSAGDYTLFMASWVLFCLGNNCAQSAFGCLLPELIPNQQRDLASGIFVFFQVLGALLSSILGLCVGKQIITDDTAYWVLIALAFGSMLTGCVAMGRRPGLWSPERRPLRKPAAPEEGDGPAAAQEGGAAPALKAAAPGALAALPAPLRTALGFFTAFTTGNFDWLFLYIFVWSSSGQFGGLFQAFWMQVLGSQPVLLTVLQH